MQKVVVLVAFAIVVGVLGCGAVQNILPTGDVTAIRAAVPECAGDADSVILQYIPDPAAADTLIQLANYALIKNDVVTAQQVSDFLDICDHYLDLGEDITGNEAVLFLVSQVDGLQEQLGAGVIILSQYVNNLKVPRVLTACDIALLKIQVAHIREKVLAVL